MSSLTQFFSGSNANASIPNNDIALQITGGIVGFTYTKTNANELTVHPGACKDRTGSKDIYMGTDFIVNIPNTANAMTHLFACGDDTIKTDDNLQGTNIHAATPDLSFRWIGFVTNDGTGEIIQEKTYIIRTDKLLVPLNFTGRGNNIDLSPVFPIERASSFYGKMWASGGGQKVGVTVKEINTFVGNSYGSNWGGEIEPYIPSAVDIHASNSSTIKWVIVER